MKTPESAQLELVVKELKKLNKNLERIIFEKSNYTNTNIHNTQEVKEDDGSKCNEV